MQLTERHVITESNTFFRRCDELTFLSKNLYNYTLYLVRQHFFTTGKFLRYATLQHMFVEERQPDFIALPAKVAQQTMKGVDNNFKAFLKALREYKKNPSKFSGKPRMPKYLDKSKGRFTLTYTSQAVSKRELDSNRLIVTSGSGISVMSKVKYRDLDCVRIVPGNGCYVVEVVYTVNDKPLLPDNGRYASIDLGVGNFATVATNCDDVFPYIVSGKELKSYNHWHNRRVAELRSVAKVRNGKITTKRISMMERKRDLRIGDFMHKASRHIVNHLVSNSITALVIGYNKGWKQDADMGAVNNQNFVQIPFLRFVRMLEYKCRLAGISCILQEESHTSKCSFLDNEEICHHDKYIGRRVKRGLFRSSDGRVVNADLNGALNILRKCKPIGMRKPPVWCNGCVVHPVIVHLWTMAKSGKPKRELDSGMRLRKSRRMLYSRRSDFNEVQCFQ